MLDRGPPLGVVDGGRVSSNDVDLEPRWTLLLFTDGIVEARTGRGSERLGATGLTDKLARLMPEASKLEAMADQLVREVKAANGEPLCDHVALFLSNAQHWSE